MIADVSVLEFRIGDILSKLADFQERPREIDPASPHLDNLFEILQNSDRSDERAQAEELIWALWCSHQDRDAARALQKATGALNRREFGRANGILDDLVQTYPRWAEAWNKRATLHFLLERDEDSLEDIDRTLALEPRHFGAVCGLGQICLRCGDETAGLAAFQFALRMNPNLQDIRSAAQALARRSKRTLH